jgi:hypothetical protein
MQLLQCHIVNDLVIAALHEGRIYITERRHSLRCKTGGKCNGMLLGYAHVKSALRHGFHHDVE